MVRYGSNLKVTKSSGNKSANIVMKLPLTKQIFQQCITTLKVAFFQGEESNRKPNRKECSA